MVINNKLNLRCGRQAMSIFRHLSNEEWWFSARFTGSRLAIHDWTRCFWYLIRGARTGDFKTWKFLFSFLPNPFRELCLCDWKVLGTSLVNLCRIVAMGWALASVENRQELWDILIKWVNFCLFRAPGSSESSKLQRPKNKRLTTSWQKETSLRSTRRHSGSRFMGLNRRRYWKNLVLNNWMIFQEAIYRSDLYLGRTDVLVSIGLTFH